MVAALVSMETLGKGYHSVEMMAEIEAPLLGAQKGDPKKRRLSLAESAIQDHTILIVQFPFLG